VQLSSVGAYGPPPGGAARARTVTEDTPVRPQGEYETTKTAADELVMEAAARGDITYTILRPSIVFGPSMPNNSLRQLGAVIRRRLFFYVGAPGAIATYVHVDDVVDALQRCARDSRACNQIFNLSNDCTVEQLVEGLAASSGVRPPRARLPERAVRLFVNAVGRFAPLPLTDARVDALVARTRYPFTKISKELGMSPSRFVPATVGDVFRSA
jgi:nucleoside-diphosphate-sugar epimerase